MPVPMRTERMTNCERVAQRIFACGGAFQFFVDKMRAGTGVVKLLLVFPGKEPRADFKCFHDEVGMALSKL